MPCSMPNPGALLGLTPCLPPTQTLTHTRAYLNSLVSDWWMPGHWRTGDRGETPLNPISSLTALSLTPPGPTCDLKPPTYHITPNSQSSIHPPVLLGRDEGHRGPRCHVKLEGDPGGAASICPECGPLVATLMVGQWRAAGKGLCNCAMRLLPLHAHKTSRPQWETKRLSPVSRGQRRRQACRSTSLTEMGRSLIRACKWVLHFTQLATCECLKGFRRVIVSLLGSSCCDLKPRS